jgi:hypothetical protein
MNDVPSLGRFWTLNMLGFAAGFAIAFALAVTVLPSDAPLLSAGLGAILPLLTMTAVGLWQLR